MVSDPFRLPHPVPGGTLGSNLGSTVRAPLFWVHFFFYFGVRFGAQMGAKLGAPEPPGATQKSINYSIDFLNQFGSILAPKMDPQATKNHSEINPKPNLV